MSPTPRATTTVAPRWEDSDLEGVSAVGALQARTEGATAVAATRLFAAHAMASSNSEGSMPLSFWIFLPGGVHLHSLPPGRNAIVNNLRFSVIGMSLAKTILQPACMLTTYFYMASWWCGASSLQPQHEYPA